MKIEEYWVPVTDLVKCKIIKTKDICNHGVYTTAIIDYVTLDKKTFCCECGQVFSKNDLDDLY